MCLAVPMEIKKIIDNSQATARQGNNEIAIDISLLQDPKPGDYVIIHAGFAIETLDLQEAEKRIDLFRQMDEYNQEYEQAD